MSSSTRPMDVWRKIVWREYITRVRRRAFLVATFLGPILMVGLVAGLVLAHDEHRRTRQGLGGGPRGLGDH